MNGALADQTENPVLISILPGARFLCLWTQGASHDRDELVARNSKAVAPNIPRRPQARRWRDPSGTTGDQRCLTANGDHSTSFPSGAAWNAALAGISGIKPA